MGGEVPQRLGGLIFLGEVLLGACDATVQQNHKNIPHADLMPPGWVGCSQGSVP